MPKAKSSRRTSTSTAPTKRSSPRASVQASSAAVRAVPARSKRSPQVEAIAVASDPAVPTHSNEPVQSMLSPQFMETLITRVADEVSRRLSPAEVSSNPSPATLATLREVPVSSPVGQNTEEVASTVVQQSLANASTALTGLIPQVSASNPVPGPLFQSVSLAVDACLSEKIRTKIWKDEYVDFGSLLANPVLVDQYQIQTAVLPPLFALSHWLSTKRLQQLKRGEVVFMFLWGLAQNNFLMRPPRS